MRRIRPYSDGYLYWDDDKTEHLATRILVTGDTAVPLGENMKHEYDWERRVPLTPVMPHIAAHWGDFRIRIIVTLCAGFLVATGFIAGQRWARDGSFGCATVCERTSVYCMDSMCICSVRP